MKEIVVIAVCLLRSVEPVMAQITHEKIEWVLGSKQQTDTSGFSNWQELKYLYDRTKDSSLWMHVSAQPNRDLMIQLLHRSDDLGLDEKDYQYDFVRSFSDQTFSLASMEDSIEAELKFSDAAIHFFSDVVYGNVSPAFGYDGLN
jgi:hypothetical protein